MYVWSVYAWGAYACAYSFSSPLPFNPTKNKIHERRQSHTGCLRCVLLMAGNQKNVCVGRHAPPLYSIVAISAPDANATG